MTMVRISVLVAVYNAEKFLRECLDSLIGQTLSDIEIICIDDCSTDSSLEILNEYARKDCRIRILRNERNMGQAVARNRGLAAAEGEYITMLDSDDWFSPDALQSAYDVLTGNGDTDCVLFRLVHVSDGKEREYPIRTEKRMLTGREAFLLSIDWSIHGLYVIKSGIHKAFPYDETALLYSDDNTTLLHYLNSGNVGFCNGTYYYRQNPDSMTHSCNIRRFDRMEADLSIKNILNGVDSKLAARFETHRWLNIVGCYYYLYENRKHFSEEEQADIERRIAGMLRTVEAEHIDARQKYKFGYYPFRNFTLFRMVEDLYFALRKIKNTTKCLCAL